MIEFCIGNWGGKTKTVLKIGGEIIGKSNGEVIGEYVWGWGYCTVGYC